MTIRLLTALRIAGVEQPAGTELDLGLTVEVDYVQRRVAEWVGEKPYPSHANSEVIDARDFGFQLDDDGENSRSTEYLSMVSQVPARAVVRMPRGTHTVEYGATCRNPITVEGADYGAIIHWAPLTAGAWLLDCTGVGATSGNMNEESQLDAPSLRRLRVLSDRSVRANGFRFIKSDWARLHDVNVYGLDGCSLDLQRSREFSILGWRARYCGHFDAADITACLPAIRFASTAASGDSTNYCYFDDLQAVYSFWDGLEISDSVAMMGGSVFVHSLALANTSLEANIVAEFGGAAGFLSGLARNILAALHQHSTGSEASVSGLPWVPMARKRRAAFIRNSSVSFDHLRIVGGREERVLWLDAASEVTISSGKINAAETSSTYHTSATFTADASTDRITFGGNQNYLFTGDPVEVSNSGGGLPGGLSTRTTYYAIRVSATVFKLAATYADAIAGTAIDLSSAGTGTHTLVCAHGETVALTSGSTLRTSERLILDDNRWMVREDATSWLLGNVTQGGTQSVANIGRYAGDVKVLFALKAADLQSTDDQQFTRVCGCNRYIVTQVVAIGVEGGATGTCAGGIYTLAAKGGTALVGASQSWLGVSAVNKLQKATLSGGDTDSSQAVPYLSLTTGSSAAARADVYILGIPADHP